MRQLIQDLQNMRNLHLNESGIANLLGEAATALAQYEREPLPEPENPRQALQEALNRIRHL